MNQVGVTLGDAISDPCGDEQMWLDRIQTNIPLPEGTKLYTAPQPTDNLEALKACRRKVLEEVIEEWERPYSGIKFIDALRRMAREG